MSDLHYGQTMSEAFRMVSGGAAYTATLNFDPDMVILNNLTTWTGTAGGFPRNFWFKDQTTAAHAFQQVVTDTAAGASFNFADLATNGFTTANTSGGVATSQCTISAITQADPCNITHSAFTFQTNQLVRITDLGPVGDATDRGMDELEGKRYRVVVVDATHITLKDPITGEAIDSSAYVAYVSGGRLTLESHSLALNYPQVSPYSDTSPYNPNAFSYDPITYRMTLGSTIMGTDGDVMLLQSFKYGNFVDLGDIG